MQVGIYVVESAIYRLVKVAQLSGDLGHTFTQFAIDAGVPAEHLMFPTLYGTLTTSLQRWMFHSSRGNFRYGC